MIKFKEIHEKKTTSHFCQQRSFTSQPDCFFIVQTKLIATTCPWCSKIFKYSIEQYDLMKILFLKEIRSK